MFSCPPLLTDRLASVLGARVTRIRHDDFDIGGWQILTNGDATLQRLGITVIGENVRVAVRSIDRPLGSITIRARAVENTVLFDNAGWRGHLLLNLRLNGVGGVVSMHLNGGGDILLTNVLLRSDRQTLFWGPGGTSVNGRTLELEGEGALVAVGDDAMISSGVSIRNFDMHSLIDLASMSQTNQPTDMIIEPHVWLGQDVLLLACPRIGYGSVIGAKSLVTSVIPAKVIAGGTPARVLRENRSWGRATDGLNHAEIGLLRSLDMIAKPS